MESVDQLLDRILPKTVLGAALMTELAGIRDHIRPQLPPGTSVELQELMGVVSVAVRLPGASTVITRTMKVIS
jgi:hypothetical protein